MIYVSITRDSIITNQGQFASMEEAQAWLDLHEGMGTFGQKAQIIEQQVEISPAVIAEDGSVLQKAVTEMQEVHIPGNYVVEIEDKSAEIAQQAINAEALAYLAATDFYIIRELDNGVPCPADIKAERQAARNRIVR